MKLATKIFGFNAQVQKTDSCRFHLTSFARNYIKVSAIT